MDSRRSVNWLIRLQSIYPIRFIADTLGTVRGTGCRQIRKHITKRFAEVLECCMIFKLKCCLQKVWKVAIFKWQHDHATRQHGNTTTPITNTTTMLDFESLSTAHVRLLSKRRKRSGCDSAAIAVSLDIPGAVNLVSFSSRNVMYCIDCVDNVQRQQ